MNPCVMSLILFQNQRIGIKTHEKDPPGYIFNNEKKGGCFMEVKGGLVFNFFLLENGLDAHAAISAGQSSQCASCLVSTMKLSSSSSSAPCLGMIASCSLSLLEVKQHHVTSAGSFSKCHLLQQIPIP